MIIVGIDWARRKHDLVVMQEDGQMARRPRPPERDRCAPRLVKEGFSEAGGVKQLQKSAPTACPSRYLW